MYLAHSKLAEPEKPVKADPKTQSEFAKQMAFKLFKKACQNRAERIARVQQHFPDWKPKFNYK